MIPAAEPGDPPPLLLAGEFAAAFTPKPGVVELLLHLADPRSAETWARRGGYLPPHLRFDAADTMPPAVGVGTFWDGVIDFVANGDLDAAVATIDAGYTDEPFVSCRLRGADTEC